MIGARLYYLRGEVSQVIPRIIERYKLKKDEIIHMFSDESLNPDDIGGPKYCEMHRYSFPVPDNTTIGDLENTFGVDGSLRIIEIRKLRQKEKGK